VCVPAEATPPGLPPGHQRARAGHIVGVESLEVTSRDGTTVPAALARAPVPAGAGVVILPDVRGLCAYYERLAERFAAAGHPAIVFDYYARTAGAARRDDSFEFQPHLTATTLDQVQADVGAALAALRDRTGPGPAVAVGFCFGGTHAFLGAARPDLDLAAVVGFYGRLGGTRLPRPADLAGDIAGQVLGLFGGADPTITAGEIAEFDSALDHAGVPHELVTYPGAPHSFFDHALPDHRDACADAWRRVLGVLARVRPGP
jgi:carboxymethylenebutenolidase